MPGAISVGQVEVDVIPTVRGISRTLSRQMLPAAEQVGEEMGKAIADRIKDGIASGIRAGVTDGGRQALPAATRQGDSTAGAFARAMRARLEAAFRSMPKLDVRLSDRGVDADLARVRAKLEQLSSKRIGVDIDTVAADRQITSIEAELQRIGAEHPNPTVRADVTAALTQLRTVRAELDRIGATPTTVDLRTDGGFAARLRSEVKAAQESLPRVQVDANTAPADARIQALRAELGALGDRRIGVDISAEQALAKVAEIRAALAQLSEDKTARVDVRVDAGRAQAQLAGLQSEIVALDAESPDIRVDADTGPALSRLRTLAIELGVILAIPAVVPVAAGIGAIGTAAVAAGAGVGALAAVAVPAFARIKNVLTLQKQAQQQATTASIKGANAARQAQQHALQLAGAEQSLAQAKRHAAESEAQAAAQIKTAEQGVTQARQQAAAANARAADEVTTAKKNLAQTEQQAAVASSNAAARVATAEHNLSTAQSAALDAQKALNAARKQGAQDLQDMNNQLADAVLSQRQDQLSLTQAQQQMQATLANPNATDLQKAQAKLSYDQAVQALKEQNIQVTRLRASTAAANKAGVNGTQAVVTAQKNLTAAQQKVTTSAAALAKAQKARADQAKANAANIAAAQAKVAAAQQNVTKTAAQGARQVAQAQARVASARRQAAVAQQNAADSVANAERSMREAQLSSVPATTAATTAQQKYRKALAGLTPAARRTLNAFVGLRKAFRGWSRALQPTVMPLFTQALNGLRTVLPALTPIVRAAAAAVGALEDKLSREVKTPFWRGFKKDLDGSVKPAIVGLGVAFGNVFKGIAGIIDAFLPHMKGISSTLDSITGRFANWGTHLKGSPAFKEFLAYAASKGPMVASVIGKVVRAAIQWGKAMTPVSTTLLEIVGWLAQFVGWVAKLAPWVIQLAGAFFLASKATAALNLAMDENPVGALVTVILVLVGVIIYLATKTQFFQTVWRVVWGAVKKAWMTTWSALKTGFDAFIHFFTRTIPHAFSTALNFIKSHWKWLPTILLGPFGLIITEILKHWSTIKHIFESAWNAIVGFFKAGWRDFKRGWSITLHAIYSTFTSIKAKIVGAARGLWKDIKSGASGLVSGIKKVWKGIKGAFARPINFVINTVWNHGIAALWNAIASKLHFLPKAPTHAKIPGYARGTSGAPSGWSWVGERGPELIHMTGGETVIPSHHSVAMAASGVVPGYAAGTPAWPAKLPGYASGWGWNPISDIKHIGSDIAGAAKTVGRTLGHAAESAYHGATGLAKKGIREVEDIARGVAGAAWDHAIKPILNSAIRSVGKLVPKGGVRDMALGLPKGAVKAVSKFLHHDDKEQSRLAIPPALGSGPHSILSIAAEAIARGMLPHYGWTTAQWPALKALWTRESGWNYRATNPSSGAYGIPQSLPASKMASAGPDWRTNPATQIKWGLNYIKHRYGSPIAAWGHETRAGWYDSGGYLPPGPSLVMNGTGRPEPVLTTGQLASLTRASGEASYTLTTNIYPRSTSLTAQQLHIAQRQQEQRLRVGRPR